MKQETITMEEARSLMKLDKNSLDTICETHSAIFDSVCVAFIESVNKRDTLKEAIDKVDATIGKNFREDNKDGKVTEAKVQEHILLHPDHDEAITEYLEAKKEAELWGAIKEAYIQRSHRIKDLTELYGYGYFTVTSTKSSKAGKVTRDTLREKIQASREREGKTMGRGG